MRTISTFKLSLVNEMVTQYRNVQLQSIENAPVNPVPNDAHSLWLSLEALKDFIKAIETEVENNPQTPVTDLGLRLYYSAYPEKTLWKEPGYEDIADLNDDPTTLNYEKKHTLVGIPTFGKTGVNYDFDPSNPATYNGTKPSPTSPIMALNHGSLIPPYTTVGEWF